MRGKLPYCVIIMMQTSFTAASMFLHEPSHVVFTPNEYFDTSDFGYSMGYRKEEHELVVGSPHADQVGRVYGCHIDSVLINNTCTNIDIEAKTLAPDYDHSDTEQSFCLGATIAVYSKYFVTCAPLFTQTNIKHYYEDTNEIKEYSGTFGTCFVYSEKNKAHRFNGILEQMKNSDGKNAFGPMYGGLGWSVLADEENELLLLAKPFKIGDIQYVNSTDLENDKQRPSASLHYPKLKNVFDFNNHFETNGLRNIGYAMAAGRFFPDDFNRILYAFSLKNKNDIWRIQFLYQEKERNGTMNLVKDPYNDVLEIKSQAMDDMFGAAMLSADVNADGKTDLLVGAPTHSQAGLCETGALYIILGGKLQEYIKKRIYKIVSDKLHSRFGSTVVTTDLDGDNLPEIVVSAPYEDSGVGAVYIISGYELNRVVISQQNVEKDPDGIAFVNLEKFQWKQRIQHKNFRSLGYSLQVVPDIDDNGCDELAIGIPRNASVMLVRCVPTVHATIWVKRPPKDVKTTDSSFTVEVCVNVSYHESGLPVNISTKLQVNIKMRGKKLHINKNKFDVDLARRDTLYCENITVDLPPGEVSIYYFEAKLDYHKKTLFSPSVFDPSWVRLSDYSELEASTSINRFCGHANCDPNLSMDILWDNKKEFKKFHVDEKTEKNVTFVIKNSGADAYDACINIKVTGARAQTNCKMLDEPGKYRCFLPKPVEGNSEYNFSIVVSIEKATNVDNTVHIQATLFNFCESESYSTSMEKKVDYTFSMKNIFVTNTFGSTRNVTVTDTQIQNQTSPTLIDKHEYQIESKGGLAWENVYAIVNVRKRPYIESAHVLITKRVDNNGCRQMNNTNTSSNGDYMTFMCSGIVLKNESISLNVRTEIPYAKIMSNLKDGELKIESNIEVRMASSTDSIQFPKISQKTIIKYVKEYTFANNKIGITIISVIAGILILALVGYILYRIGFFQRKEKKRLDSFKASVKQKNRSESEAGKPSTSGGGESKPEPKEDSLEDFDIEVIEDCPFDPVPATTADDVALITEDKTEDIDASTADNKIDSKGKGDRQSTRM